MSFNMQSLRIVDSTRRDLYNYVTLSSQAHSGEMNPSVAKAIMKPRLVYVQQKKKMKKSISQKKETRIQKKEKDLSIYQQKKIFSLLNYAIFLRVARTNLLLRDL